MTNLYHLSHFFEFLTGLYFGGLALLEFLQNKATVPFSELLEIRQQSANNAKTQVIEYYQIRVTADKGALKAMSNSFKWVCWCVINYPANLLFNFTHTYITSLIGDKGNFIRRHFPVFFFTGCFCLFIVLFSGVEDCDIKTFSSRFIDSFFISYCFAAILFQMWGIFIFPALVRRNDYLMLTAVNIIICFVLILVTYLSSKYGSLIFNFDYFTLEDNKKLFVIIVIIISLFPIACILIWSAIVLTFFILSTYFYNLTLRWYKAKVGVLKDIKVLE
jgi:hypothetical protein